MGPWSLLEHHHIGVIGGADGPTAILVAGPSGPEVVLLAFAVGIVVGIAAGYLWRRWRNRKK